MIYRIKEYLYTSGRNQTADLMKGTAVIFMIQVHIMENFTMHYIHEELPGIISFFWGGTPAAPVFMIVMGFYLAYSKKNLLNLFSRGFLLFAGGLMLNIVLNFNLLYSITTGRFDTIDPFPFIFGADILPFAGLSIIIIALIKQVLEKDWYYYFIVAVIIALITSYIPEIPASLSDWIYYVTAFIWGSSEWSYFPLLPWLFYPLIGYALNLMHNDKNVLLFLNKKNKIILLSITSIFLFASFSYAIDEIITLKNYYHHGLFLAIWNTLFVLIWYFLLNFIELKAGENVFLIYIKWIGKNVTVVYVIQWIIIGNLATELYGTQNEFQSFFWLIGIIIIVSLLTYTYDRIFVVRKLMQN